MVYDVNTVHFDGNSIVFFHDLWLNFCGFLSWKTEAGNNILVLVSKIASDLFGLVASEVSGKMGEFPTLTRLRVTNHQCGERHPNWDAAFILLLYNCKTNGRFAQVDHSKNTQLRWVDPI